MRNKKTNRAFASYLLFQGKFATQQNLFLRHFTSVQYQSKDTIANFTQNQLLKYRSHKLFKTQRGFILKMHFIWLHNGNLREIYVKFLVL